MVNHDKARRHRPEPHWSDIVVDLNMKTSNVIEIGIYELSN